MPFKPGQSGNPGGRPKVVGDVQKLARSHTDDAIKDLVAIGKSVKTPAAARVAAWTAVLDRGYGKPRQSIDTNTTDKKDASDWTTEELERLLSAQASDGDDKAAVN